MESQEILDLMRKAGGLLEGHFELRSGLHSDRFFQCAHVLKYPDLAERLCRDLAAKIQAGMGGRVVADGVIAPALGGLVVGHEVARALGVKSIFAEKQDGRLVMRRFAISPGERLVVAEDVVTRGGRVQETIDIVQSLGGQVVAVGMLVDRSAGSVKFDYPTFSLLQLAPTTWNPAQCPLCKSGVPFVHPGS